VRNSYAGRESITPFCSDPIRQQGTMTQRISFYCADAVGGREQEPNMSLLFWYLPFIILSGAYESVYSRGEGSAKQE
jgi:hypothetical protein